MNENIIKSYIINKVSMIVKNFIETTAWRVDRLFISAIKEEYLWSVTSCNGTLSRIGFRFMEPNKLCFYEFNHWGEEIDCFVWEFPNIIVDAPSHPMSASSLMRELWRYIHRTMMDTDIQSEYKSFLASINRKPKLNLNALYGSTSMSLDEETKKANILKGLSEALGMPIITSSQTCKLSSYNKEEYVMIIPGIENVFFNEVKKTTTVVFLDHTSVIVKCTDNDHFDPEMGLAMAIARRYFGSRTKVKKAVDKWVATSAPKNEQLRKKAARKAEKEAAKVEHFKAQTESYME